MVLCTNIVTELRTACKIRGFRRLYLIALSMQSVCKPGWDVDNATVEIVQAVGELDADFFADRELYEYFDAEMVSRVVDSGTVVRIEFEGFHLKATAHALYIRTE